MGKIAFLELFETKGLGKGREWHLKKRQRVNKAYSVKVHLHQLAAITHLFNNAVLPEVPIHDEVAIVALKIVSDDGEGAGVILCQGVEPFEKVFDTSFAFETDRTVIVLGFSHHQVRNMASGVLHGFDIKEHMQWGLVVFVLKSHAFPIRFQGS